MPNSLSRDKEKCEENNKIHNWIKIMQTFYEIFSKVKSSIRLKKCL